MPTVQVPEGLARGVASWAVVGGVLGALMAGTVNDPSGPLPPWARLTIREGTIIGASLGAAFIIAVVLVFGAE